MNNQEEIRKKGFKMTRDDPNEEYTPDYKSVDFSRIKVGLQLLEGALADLNYYTKTDSTVSKENIMRALHTNNLPELRRFSNFFYKNSGIYARLCKYMAYLYKYDWLVTPIIVKKELKNEKVVEGFYKALALLDEFNPKKQFGDIALKIMRNGAYYGYQVESNGKLYLQELPANYCRSRFFIGNRPAVEFNMKFFDDTFSDTEQRNRIIKMFPKEFQKAYGLYKQGKLPRDFSGDSSGWYQLSPDNAIKFCVYGEEVPLFASIIPAILDLEDVQTLDKRRLEQLLLKILIQQMPIDKNGELIFDVDEAKALHNNAVAMLGKTIGVDVLTTFADVTVEDMSDRRTSTSVDEIIKFERGIFNEAGVSQMQFNADKNLALKYSIANDEASLLSLITQFEIFLNDLLKPFNKNPKRLVYRAQILPTTIYNYQDLAKLYKEQMTIGFSKMLPQIALGQSQSVILATAYFENSVLDLNSLFVPPASSSTTPGGDTGEEKTPGRNPLPDEDKADKTIQNQESAT